MLNRTILLSILAVLTAIRPGSAAADLSAQVQFDIRAQQLSTALLKYSEQSGVQISGPGKLIEGKSSTGVSGTLAARDGLERLLKGTDLAYDVIDSNTILIRAADRKSQGSVSPSFVAGTVTPVGENDMRLAQTEQEKEKSTENRGKQKAAEATQENVVVVTGTNIHGSGPVGQQIEVITREDMTRDGITNMKQLRDLIPQNFSGGNADPVVNNTGQTGAATINSPSGTYSSNFNLRGLGSNSTLTLLNGRRVAPSGTGDSFGITAIPVSIVDRVEIVPDGGSAIYGSDAVGGVINVITRTDFQGVEAGANYSSAGGYTSRGGSVLAGQSWGTGNAFAYGSFARETKLVTGDRDFISKDFLSDDGTLIPDSKRKGFYGSVNQNFGPRLQVGVDALWTDEDSRFDLDTNLLGGVPGGISLNSRALTVSGHGVYALTDAWDLKAGVDYSTNENVSHSDSEDVGLPTEEFSNESTTFELSVAGPAMQLPAGKLQLAFGALQRKQTFDQLSSGDPGVSKRDITSAYGEVLVPVARGLKLNLAGRWDDYSNGGSRFTPKYGISWQAAEGLSLRASYAQAFRVPSLAQQRNRQSMSFQSANWAGRAPGDQDPRLPAGRSYLASFFRSGNSDLQPESARIFTTGFDAKPAILPGFSLGVTYFNIEYSNIILSIFPTRLNDPAFADFVYPSPDRELLQELYDQAETRTTTLNFPIDLDAVQVLIDGGLHNLASMKTSGFDINSRYGIDLGEGKLKFSFKATYILNYTMQTTRLSAPANNVDRVGDPLRLTTRTSVSYSLRDWTVSTALNYKGSYIDDIYAFVKPARVDSLTTYDLGLMYTPSWSPGLDISVRVNNLTNEDPPYVQDFYGFNYDTGNGNPMGRFVFVEVSKSWGH